MCCVNQEVAIGSRVVTLVGHNVCEGTVAHDQYHSVTDGYVSHPVGFV